MARSEIQLQTVWRGKLGPEGQIEMDKSDKSG